MEHPVFDYIIKQRFEIRHNGLVAFIEYQYESDSIALMHTLVPEEMKNQGIASTLATYAFAYAKKLDKPVRVYCPFIGEFVKRHPELKVQLDKTFHTRAGSNVAIKD